MKKNILLILIALITGGLLGKFTFERYEALETKEVSISKNYAYFLKYGTYDNYEKMNESVNNVERFIYIQTNDSFEAFVGVTKSKESAEKIAKVYKEQKINVEVIKKQMDADKFIESLNEYEKLILATEDANGLLMIEKQILSKYEELVVNYG